MDKAYPGCSPPALFFNTLERRSQTVAPTDHVMAVRVIFELSVLVSRSSLLPQHVPSGLN